jgi:hypothetical protein
MISSSPGYLPKFHLNTILLSVSIQNMDFEVYTDIVSPYSLRMYIYKYTHTEREIHTHIYKHIYANTDRYIDTDRDIIISIYNYIFY